MTSSGLALLSEVAVKGFDVRNAGVLDFTAGDLFNRSLRDPGAICHFRPSAFGFG